MFIFTRDNRIEEFKVSLIVPSLLIESFKSTIGPLKSVVGANTKSFPSDDSK